MKNACRQLSDAIAVFLVVGLVLLGANLYQYIVAGKEKAENLKREAAITSRLQWPVLAYDYVIGEDEASIQSTLGEAQCKMIGNYQLCVTVTKVEHGGGQ